MSTNNTSTKTTDFTVGETFIGEGIINNKSTNNMNPENTPSQTLFRFATMRNAELSDHENKERRFIFRDYATQKGVIDPRVEAGQSLKTVCREITGLTIETEASLKAQDVAFYELAVWVARNKAKATKEEFDAKIRHYREYQQQIIRIDSKIWDNLVYQVVIQKDFYAKETLMQLLHLDHILRYYDGFNQARYEYVIKAKVVLPKELFKVETGSQSVNFSRKAEVIKEKLGEPFYNEKDQKYTEAAGNLRLNQDLSTSLNKLEKVYQKEYQKAYNVAYENYLKEVKPIQTDYQKRLSETENRKKVIENRVKYLTELSIANPELYVKNPDLKEELYKLNEELLSLHVSPPDLPEFSLEFRPEINPEEIGRVLTDENRYALNRIFGGASVGEALEGISTFAEISGALSQDSQLQQQQILNNTVLNQPTFTNIGGVLVPVTNSLNNNGVIPFSTTTRRVPLMPGIGHSIVVTTDINQPKHIISGNYQVKVGGQTIATGSGTDPWSGAANVTSLFQNNKIPHIDIEKIEVIELEGDVVLSDGLSYTMQATLNRTNNDTSLFQGRGIFTPKDRVVDPTDPGNPGNPSNPNTPEGTFIPSGFGMKNIGITDYRKVEQSTYCYVEGDVAHIENIMAREYKERATRRLKRSESQTTKSTESEKEKLTDTTSTERNEMQSEVSKILQESKDFAAQAGFNASWGAGASPKYMLNTAANYATHNSKEESNRQAVTDAKDITARALDRIVTKVKEERIDKILEEYEENNKHGFDNTKGSNHVVGVYRWVDKVVKNQIYNYGKRMMFEFMVPEPAKLHTLGMKASKIAENLLIKPIDPRTSIVNKMENFASLDGASGDMILKYWLSKYKVDINKKPEEFIYVGKAFSNTAADSDGRSEYDEAIAGGAEIQIPENYVTVAAIGVVQTGGEGVLGHYLRIGGAYMNGSELPINNFYQVVPVSFSLIGSHAIDVNASVKCKLTTEAKNEWLQTTFNKIVEAYEIELGKYEAALADAKALGIQIKGSNPGFYRKIENTILRRNCISYMLDQNPNAELTFGKNKYYQTDNSTESFTNTEIKVDGTLDRYAAFVKFMEQAFEWEIMSYYLYPYYWGNRANWADLYQFDDNDPVFRAFMQSGMARVIVTVRPGFEESVRHFLATGQIWNGGEVPVIDDPLFLSIVDELRSPKATKEGEPWREKIPTSLTILQADSIGLKVEKALPCNCEPGVKFDDNLGEMCESNFELNNSQIGQSSDRWIEISFNHMDYYQTIGEMEEHAPFPRKYECLGNSITVERDASWSKLDSTIKFYQSLADELSLIEGLEASPTSEYGITFKINVTKIKNFKFVKPGGSKEFDTLQFLTDGLSYLKMITPEYLNSASYRIADKDGQQIPNQEYVDKIPLSKFLV
ncbi:hypothetical protein B0A69_09020 [Chryseobacterium shigense]|uniref:Uncharacterized protein n=1 Tax=Chryseobacterium shigense TaxID=297244 RepID=A0A1N7IFY5_9FLAO|nr:hypothetical protein [Chryseobacterium shigense]PQA94593.1 hypothetical protein B0A69_09020 [Chryseobacterium shigense]SIS35960.1 hypothetical protein SAMN05421639_103591 [Chryseobacterium shigense]